MSKTKPRGEHPPSDLPAALLREPAAPVPHGEDKVVGGISDLLRHLAEDVQSNQVCWYRGHDLYRWKLLPTLARNSEHLAAELDLLGKFQQDASLLLVHSALNQEWQWLTIMQHHGCPTRLLDWSESPLVALYFAVSNKDHLNEDGALWLLLPHRLNELRGIRPKYPKQIPSFGDEVMTAYTPTTVSRETMSTMGPIAIIGPRNTPRMQAQLGVFTIIHRDATAIEEVPPGPAGRHVWRYRIRAQDKPRIIQELALLGVKKFQLFPELSSIGEILKGGLA